MLAAAKLLLDEPLDTLDAACRHVDDHQPSKRNCSKPLIVSTTCVESWPTERSHLTQTAIECPGDRLGNCTEFRVKWCNNSVYPAKGGCYRSEYAAVDLMNYSEYWFGFSLFLPSDYAVDVDSIAFQIHGVPNKDVDEAYRNPMFALEHQSSSGHWLARARGDPRRNITYHNRTYKWDNLTDVGAARLGEWEHWVYHTRYSFAADGFVELWRNGERVVQWNQTGTAYNDEKGPYFKLGIYSWTWGKRPGPPLANASTNVVIYGGFKQGDRESSYEEVDTSRGEGGLG